MPTALLINEATIYGAAHSGVARHMRQIARAAAEHYGRHLTVCSEHRIAPRPARWIPSPRFRGSGRLHTTDIIATAASALFHPRVYFSNYYGSARTSAREVFMVHDLIHELLEVPESGDPMLQRWIVQKRRCLERAAALVTNSRNTAADIVRVYPHVDPAKIFVAYLGVDELFFRGTPAQSAQRPYFIWVGVRVGRKNFLRLIEAFALSGAAADDFDLLVVSRGGSFTPAEKAIIDRGGIGANVHLIAPVPDAELANLYAGSVALLYPSEYEGFGLPALEAMAAGTLVVTSATSSLPEVGGDAAFYVNPLDVASIAETIRAVAHLDAGERARRTRMGIERARTFTWSRCERQTMDVFDRLLSAS